MNQPSILDCINYGPMKVVLDAETGAVVGVLDLASGCAAEKVYTPASVAKAKTYARAFWQSRIDH